MRASSTDLAERDRAPAVGIEPTRSPLNRRAPDHSASLEKRIPCGPRAPHVSAWGRGERARVARTEIDVELSESEATARSP